MEYFNPTQIILLTICMLVLCTAFLTHITRVITKKVQQWINKK